MNSTSAIHNKVINYFSDKYYDNFFKTKGIPVSEIVNSNGDIEDYKMFENVINPKNNMEAWERSLNRNYYDGVEW